ncbi:hypothetical protein BO221_06560 [Archangium sp. Cb G35]|uniref:hypothetical protein n=1 Tax=Archangium sp. Cb G35 TaxID=1920190 RepID=UPI000937B051|nr:hypothetical protein [Archangium sp. Cb G35]OJT25530.1 hypothetical protein BO221_06560 [Archangium sp. Cb G35]
MRPSCSLLRRLCGLSIGGAVLGLLVSCGAAAPESFEHLKWEYGGGPCTEEMDCNGWDEVLADGTFRVDRFGDPGGVVRETVLPAEELQQVREAATRAELLGVLWRGKTPCGRVTDSSSMLTLELEGASYRAQLAGCDEPGVDELRTLLERLRDTYAP